MIDTYEDQLTALKNLVLSYEYKEQELRCVPQEQIDYFGYACLSNSLMFKEPSIPQYNAETITQYFQTHTFNTIESLISYIKGLSDDIDKLFAIFSWEAMNIKYDVDALQKGEIRDKSLEIIFSNKAAVCEGYCLFFREMIKKTNINPRRIRVRNYYSYSKPYEYDPSSIPTEVEPNHCSLFIFIDNIPFISDPSRAAGYLTSDNKFEQKYQPDLFLIPLVKTVCDRMPCDDFLIPFHFSLADFFKSCRISPIGIHLKTESNPFIQIESTDGYVSQIYSCITPVNWIQINILKRDRFDTEIFNEIESENITSYEILQEMIPNHPERCRLRTNISFQEEGYYKVELYVSGLLQTSYYVNNLSKSELPIPITYNPFNDSKFVPIKPSRILSKVKHGVALIRFAVSLKKSDILWNIIKLNNRDGFDDQDGQIISRECGKFHKLKIPFDETRYEDQLCISFPSNGRFSVQIYLANDSGSYSSHSRYFIDVEGAEERDLDQVMTPIEFMCQNRDFSTVTAFDSNKNAVKISPDSQCHVIDQSQLEQTIQLETFSEDQKVLLEFRKKKELVLVPDLKSKDKKKSTFSWKVPDEEGEYQLVGFVDDSFAFSVGYIYRKKPLREEDEIEAKILDDLKQKVIFDKQYESVYGKKEEENGPDDIRSSSKCCLLI